MNAPSWGAFPGHFFGRSSRAMESAGLLASLVTSLVLALTRSSKQRHSPLIRLSTA
jgi:hypothetical protein